MNDTKQDLVPVFYVIGGVLTFAWFWWRANPDPNDPVAYIFGGAIYYTGAIMGIRPTERNQVSALRMDNMLAVVPTTCFRCSQLGLPPKGIAAGDKCIMITSKREMAVACMDCFNRLSEEIGVKEESEGEEWKRQ